MRVHQKKFLLLGVISLFISGCATIRQPLSVQYKQSIRSIAVVSMMGDRIEAIKVGTTVFNNERFDEKYSAFEMDKEIEESIGQYLRQHSGFKVSAVPDLKTKFQKVVGETPNWTKILKGLNSSLEDLKTKEIDAVLVVSRESINYEDSSVFACGYGLAVRTFLMLWYAQTYCNLEFTLIDTSTEKVIFDRSEYWWKELKFSKWQKTFSQLTTAEQDAINSFLRDVVDRKIPMFLTKNNF